MTETELNLLSDIGLAVTVGDDYHHFVSNTGACAILGHKRLTSQAQSIC